MSFSGPKNRIVYFYIAYVAVLVTLASSGYFLADKMGILKVKGPATASHVFVSDMAYYDLPRITVSLAGGSSTRVRVDISLEVARKDLPLIEGYQPRITDRLNGFFERVRPEQLEQFSSQPFLREEMLRIVNGAGAPVPVHDLMFRQMVMM